MPKFKGFIPAGKNRDHKAQITQVEAENKDQAQSKIVKKLWKRGLKQTADIYASEGTTERVD
jgi:hypothetical protein